MLNCFVGVVGTTMAQGNGKCIEHAIIPTEYPLNSVKLANK